FNHTALGGGLSRRRLRPLSRRDRLVAIGLSLLQPLAARELPRRQRLLPVELESSPRGTCLRRSHLRIGLLDGGLLRRDLLPDALDRRLLSRNPFTRRVDGKPVIAVVDPSDDLAR